MTYCSAADKAVLFYSGSLSAEPKQPSRVWSAGSILYSRGKCTDVFVPTEGQTDCSKGSTLVEHLCHLGGQIAR